MTASLLPETRVGSQPDAQRPLALATEGVLRLVWEGAFGSMLIEVQDGAAYVNGDRVLSMDELRGSAPAG